MADLNFEPVGGGGTPSAGGSHKKGFKVSKPALYIGGAVIIILFLVIKGRSNSSANTSATDTNVAYPSNSVDVASQLQNNADIINSQVQQQLNSFQSDQTTNQNQFLSDLTNQQNSALSGYNDQLKSLSDKMSSMQGVLDNISSHPNPGAAPAPAPAAPAPAAPSGPSWLGALTSGPRVGGNLNTNTSIVDRLKSQGYASDFNSRAQLAGAMGIGGYSGTASQNVQMLNNLKSAGM